METTATGQTVEPKDFGVDREELRLLLETALERGGDYADVYFEHRVAGALVLEDDRVRGVSRNLARGVGIRVVRGEQVGFAFSDDLSWEAMARAARIAGSIAAGNTPGRAADLRAVSTRDLYRLHHPEAMGDLRRKLEIVQRANAAARDTSAHVSRVTVNLTDEVRRLLFANSEGATWTDVQPLLRMDVVALTERGGRRESATVGGGGRFGLEYFERRSPEMLAGEAVRIALHNLEAREAPVGQLPVVLGAGDSGVLLHEAVGHGLEADFNRKGLSTYSERVGHPVASPLCTVVDTGLFPNARGSINVDDEGNSPGETVLIEDGILRGYLHDRLSARLTGAPSTGNGRRDGYAAVPLPRMTNTYLKPGAHDPDEILASVERGIYAKRFGGGEVNITNGDFVFGVTEAYLIEDGKVTAPVKGVTLIGNGPQAMSKMTMVGSDLRHSDGTWTCGKQGQMVPVGVGMPTVRIDDMTVGGTQARRGA